MGAEMSFDSNQSSPAALENGIGHLHDRINYVRKQKLSKTQARTPIKSPLSPPRTWSPRDKKHRDHSGKSGNSSPIVKAFRSKVFRKQGWIKSRSQESGQSRESDSIELQSVERMTDSGYRSGGAEGKASHSLPRIPRSRSTFTEGPMQVTRYEQKENQRFCDLPGIAAGHCSRPGTGWLNAKTGAPLPKFMSSDSSLMHAIRRSSSTSFLPEEGFGQYAPKSPFVGREGRNRVPIVGPGAWQGPVTAL